MPATKSIEPPEEIGFLSMAELAAILIRREGLHEGWFEPSVKFNLTVGVFGVAGGAISPGVLNTVAGVGLVRAGAAKSPIAVDAAAVNPLPETKSAPVPGRKRAHPASK